LFPPDIPLSAGFARVRLSLKDKPSAGMGQGKRKRAAGETRSQRVQKHIEYEIVLGEV
jgi:hypothetical protein